MRGIDNPDNCQVPTHRRCPGLRASAGSKKETLKRILAREIVRAEQATAVYLRWFAENASGNDALSIMLGIPIVSSYCERVDS